MNAIAGNIAVNNVLYGKVSYEISDINEDSARSLVNSSRKMARQLRQSDIKERVRELKKIRHRIFQQRGMVIDAVVAETGKSRTDALVSEVMGTLDYIDWLVAKGRKALKDEVVGTPLALLGKKSKIYHEPLGVVLVIAPWNYPFHIGMTTMLAALLAGNTVILKSSEVTPLRGLFERILAASTWFSQCVSVVYGGGRTAENLIAQRPDKIVFTGSARTGKKILAQAASMLIPVDLELGGKDAAIVFDDVDIGRTAAGVMWGGMTNAGQSCTSVEIAYIHKSIWDKFTRELASQAEAMIVNSGDRGDADMGAMTTGFQLDIVNAHIRDAVGQGAVLLAGGSSFGQSTSTGTGFLAPTLLVGVTDKMRVMTEESFGPLIALVPFNTEAEVISKVNSSEFGLSASVWTKNQALADRVARALDVGAVSINNVMLTEGNPELPFGGTKQSGFGRVKGVEGLRALTRSKAVIVDKQSGKREANWYPYTRVKYQLFDKFIQSLAASGLLKLIGFAINGIKLEAESQKGRGE